MQAQTSGGGAPAPGVRLVPRAAAGASGGCRGSPGQRGRALEAGDVAPNAVDERALSATDVSYEGRRLADTELLTPPTTDDDSMGHLHRPHSASATSAPDVVTDTRRAPHGMCKCAIDIGRWAACVFR